MMGWCSKQCDLESTEGKGTPSLCSSALAHRVNEHWKNIWWIESLDVRPEHRHTLIAPKIPCFSSYTEEKAFILCVSTTKGGLLHFNHYSLSKRRIPCVIAEQEWFLGTNASSKLHSQLHHRFLLSVTRREVLLLTALPWIYHPKWKYWGLALTETSICSSAPLCEGIILGEDGLVPWTGWTQSPPILLSTPMAWFQLCSAPVQLSTPLQGGRKNTRIFLWQYVM